MKSCFLLMVFMMLSFECRGAALEDSSRNQDSSLWSPCPITGDIAPCVCTEEINGLVLDCSAVESNSQLAEVFQANFPVKDFFQFRIDNNNAVTELTHGLNSVTFEIINVQFSTVQHVSDSFILETAQTLRELYFSNGMLTENSISWGVLEKVPNLKYFWIRNSDGFTEIPPLSCQSLIIINFGGNGITSLSPGTFDDMPNLGYIYLWGNQLTVIKSNSFTITPTLKIININSNLIKTVEPNAFIVQDTVTEAFLNIDLSSNLMEELPEESFGNVFPYLKMLHIYGNPLLCGCDIAWIITNPDHISKIDPAATCKDGMNLHDLDPAKYEQYC